MNRRLRDTILILSLIGFFGLVLIVFNLLINTGDAKRAYVYFYNLDEHLVTVDFENERVIINEDMLSLYQQTVKNDRYPYLDHEKAYIYMLGMYQINGIYQEMIIKYDFSRHSMQIIKEESPYNTCSREGESTGKPIICLPNSVRIEFDNSSHDFIQ